MSFSDLFSDFTQTPPVTMFHLPRLSHLSEGAQIFQARCTSGLSSQKSHTGNAHTRPLNAFGPACIHSSALVLLFATYSPGAHSGTFSGKLLWPFLLCALGFILAHMKHKAWLFTCLSCHLPVHKRGNCQIFIHFCISSAQSAASQPFGVPCLR